jgi:hypothetical protein
MAMARQCRPGTVRLARKIRDCGAPSLAEADGIVWNCGASRLGGNAMRFTLIAAAAAIVLFAPAAHGEDAPQPNCQVQKAREVSFRNASAKDVLEVTVGTGPCAAATLTIVIRSDVGHILYSYVEQFEQHVVHSEQDPLHTKAVPFVDGLLQQGLGTTAELPPWLEPEAYEQKHAAEVQVTREEYERLRANPRPMFTHPTYHEGWRSMVWDEKEDEPMTVVTGGV